MSEWKKAVLHWNPAQRGGKTITEFSAICEDGVKCSLGYGFATKAFPNQPFAGTGEMPIVLQHNSSNAVSAASFPGQTSKASTKQPALQQAGEHFHNPYNFIPAYPIPHDTGNPIAKELLQHPPRGHEAYWPGCYSGSITINIKAVSPLLLPDTSKSDWGSEKQKGHQATTTLQINGSPLLKPTALKGPLRTLYESATNSRLGVLEVHKERLARRMNPTEGLSMVPARISDDGKDLELFLGMNLIAPSEVTSFPTLTAGRFTPPSNTMYAAWLPRYDNALKFQNGGGTPSHRDKVWCVIEKRKKIIKNTRKNRDDTERIEISEFCYYSVRRIYREQDAHLISQEGIKPLAPVTGPITKWPRQQHVGCGESFETVWGYVCVTGENIANKHDERVFFAPKGFQPKFLPMGPANSHWLDEWRLLVESYKVANKREANKRTKPEYEQFLSSIRPAFSQHLIAALEGKISLDERDLCYARTDGNGNITGLYPVMIARELMNDAPINILDGSLKPATSFGLLSPADRVFGWVTQQGENSGPKNRVAWKGQLRVASVTHNPGTGGIAKAGSGSVPLAILSSPKPQQTRFYAARDQSGRAVKSGLGKYEIGYGGDYVKGLRGRKVYPYQPHNVDYWNLAPDPDAHWQRRGDVSRDNQNRSIKDWVKPGTEFTAEIDVVNLSRAELGALFWLLDLGADEKHFMRVGGGKPLGFGSVSVKVIGLDLRDGEAMKAFFKSLKGASGGQHLGSLGDMQPLISYYQKALAALYPETGGFEEIRVIKALKKAMTGFADRITVAYPRARDGDTNDLKEESFHWFVENERIDSKRLSLPELWAPSLALPVYQTKPRYSRGGR